MCGVPTVASLVHDRTKGTNMSADSDRTDISTEPSPGPEEHDNLGARDGKGDPATVPPAEAGGSEDGDVLAEDPEQES